MTTIYEHLGVRSIINAKGPSTRLSGGPMRSDVAQAMVEASQHCVDMAELQARASEIIAEITGAEAGLVTSGAAAGLLLGTAACVTGLDAGQMNRLPETAGVANEIVMVRSQRNFYDHMIRAVGVRLVEVGLPDRYAGAGSRDAEAWEIADALSERTAAVHWVAAPGARPRLEQVVEVAHAAGVPVLVDAAAQLPPADNLRRFIEAGADLVAFSGGKAIGGPQASGILCGRRYLIMAAALQNLDLDVFYELWAPPAHFIDKTRLKGLPHHGIGRGCKVGKEEIVGLLTALRLFVEEDAGARRARWRALMQELVDDLADLRHATVGLLDDEEVPRVALDLDEAALGMSALELMKRLEHGAPAVFADPSAIDRGRILFAPMCLKDGEPTRIAERVRALLGRAA
ncbi:MAG TPA: aminotransferase class V-fold PLP-dependent enzyme [Geminicoccaceae bacterium]|jgi:L-seryl-tRNA(Ser) seleniumtransferase|nr:aminotransferase class V-fold PLP-dependent enzyme [Geminicoccaceae bacterium]